MSDLGIATLLLASGTAVAAVLGAVRYHIVFCSEPSRGPNGQVVHNLFLGIERRKSSGSQNGGTGGLAPASPAGGAASGSDAGRSGAGESTTLSGSHGVHVYVVWKR